MRCKSVFVGIELFTMLGAGGGKVSVEQDIAGGLDSKQSKALDYPFVSFFS